MRTPVRDTGGEPPPGTEGCSRHRGSGPAFELADVSVTFGSVHALHNLELHADRGEVFGLLGPNGSGKTTTVNVLTTLLRPDSGVARVCGVDVVRQSSHVRRLISVTGQFAAVDPALTVVENIRLFARLSGLGRATARRRTDEIVEALDLGTVRERRVGGLSGGMLRRVDIGCALVARPEVLFLDEPTTGLDPSSRRAVWELVDGLTGDGVSILLTTQYLEEADRLADRIAVMDQGRVVAEGAPAELKHRVGDTVCDIRLATAEAAKWVREDDRRDWHPLDPEHPELVSVDAADGVDTLLSVLSDVRATGVEVVDAALRRPTLDEVFLNLTGSTARGSVAREPVDAHGPSGSRT